MEKYLVMMKIRIKENALLARLAAKIMKTETMALAFGKTIYLHNTSKQEFLQNTKWVRHEVAHIYQSKQKGVVLFLLLYLIETFKVGYENNKYEVNARAKENDATILNDVEFI